MATLTGLFLVAIWMLIAVKIAASFYVPCEFVTDCPELSCDEDHQELRDCCPVCVQHHGEICGGSADLQCASGLTCRYRLGVLLMEEATTGRCEPEACDRQLCSYRRYCIKRSHFKYPSCICGTYNCWRKYNPVCGYDGITYDSVCHLRREECYYKFVGLRHFGNCTVVRVTPPPATPPPTTKSKSSLNNPIQEEPEEESPPSSPLGGPFSLQTPENDDEPQDTECEYNGKRIALNKLIREDSCTYIFCNEYGIIEVVKVPGCQGDPPEKYYYEDVFAITGDWTPWTPWSECEGPCVNATRRRSRECTNPPPKYEGHDCEGPSEHVEVCLPEGCNYTCPFSNWTEWSSCSGTCGEGLSIRTRTLLEEIPATYRNRCVLKETSPCEVGATCECQRRQRTYDHLDGGNGCHTVWKHPSYFCAGTCRNKGRHQRFCQAKIQMMDLITQCPGEPFWRLMQYEHVANCRCVVSD